MILPVSMGTQPLPGSRYNDGTVTYCDTHTLPMSECLQTKRSIIMYTSVSEFMLDRVVPHLQMLDRYNIYY